jgi:hypothetical protein
LFKRVNTQSVWAIHPWLKSAGLVSPLSVRRERGEARFQQLACLQGHRDEVGSVTMHPLAFGARIAFPARITSQRAGPVRVSGSGINTRARCSAAHPLQAPGGGPRGVRRSVRTGVIEAARGARSCRGGWRRLSGRQVTHLMPSSSLSRLPCTLLHEKGASTAKKSPRRRTRLLFW